MRFFGRYWFGKLVPPKSAKAVVLFQHIHAPRPGIPFRMRTIGWAVAVLAVWMCMPVEAKDKPGRGRGEEKHTFESEKPGRGRGHDSTPPVRSFRVADRAVILDYYRRQPGGLPPGLAKRGGNLPSGLEKQIRRNGTLPSGLRSRFVLLPPELEYRLPPCPEGFERGFIGGVALMWNPRTGLVLDAVALFGQ